MHGVNCDQVEMRSKEMGGGLPHGRDMNAFSGTVFASFLCSLLAHFGILNLFFPVSEKDHLITLFLSSELYIPEQNNTSLLKLNCV